MWFYYYSKSVVNMVFDGLIVLSIYKTLSFGAIQLKDEHDVLYSFMLKQGLLQ